VRSAAPAASADERSANFGDGSRAAKADMARLYSGSG
jgi:hypothetical protein